MANRPGHFPGVLSLRSDSYCTADNYVCFSCLLLCLWYRLNLINPPPHVVAHFCHSGGTVHTSQYFDLSWDLSTVYLRCWRYISSSLILLSFIRKEKPTSNVLVFKVRPVICWERANASHSRRSSPFCICADVDCCGFTPIELYSSPVMEVVFILGVQYSHYSSRLF